jgi:cell division protein FtsB
MKRRKMGLIPKIIVGCLAVYAVINLLHLQTDINDLREKRDELIELVEKQRRENAMLEESVNAELDEEAVAEAARSELGLVAPDEIIFIDTSH